MKMIRAIIRPEQEAAVKEALEKAGQVALTKIHVFGRGKQVVQLGPLVYDEFPKVLLMAVVEDDKVAELNRAITEAARTGHVGDGKIFVSPVDEVYTIRTGERGL
ncbi:MAG: P-II family nitrogen regulator [Thermaerobacter sp.]|jgi:nitrogen regulatory protein PII 1|nr:P-II family nitrogen regulator [Thermaerobacter sp.]MDA8146855.1 P-II family nitrogen regulator [Thermaerobacter sp.]